MKLPALRSSAVTVCVARPAQSVLVAPAGTLRHRHLVTFPDRFVEAGAKEWASLLVLVRVMLKVMTSPTA